MRHLLKTSKLALFSVAAGSVFALLALVVPNSILLPFMNSLCVGIVGAVTVAYSPLIKAAVKDKDFDRVSQLAVGMMLMWVSLLGSRFTNLYVNITGDKSIVDSPVISFLAYLAIIGGVLHISSPTVSGGRWQHDKRALIAGIVVGLLLAASAVFIQQAI